MASYYEVPVSWLDSTKSEGRGLGNNVAWRCKCGETLLATSQYSPPPPCPGCHRRYELKFLKKGGKIDSVSEI